MGEGPAPAPLPSAPRRGWEVSRYTPHDKERIVDIATRLLDGMAQKGEVDPADDAAMDAAMKRCVRDAATIYNAALEYVCG
jgi:hypothetical protein